MGKATAVALARMGATVVMLCRDRARGQAAVDEVNGERGMGNGKAELLVGDVGSRASVRAAAEEFRRKHQRLEVLANNAGVNLGTRTLTVDGVEATFATNHLGMFQLTHLLLDVLKASAPSRIVVVSSAAHKQAKMRFDDLQFEQKYPWNAAYAQSKLANLLFTYELARRLSGTGVTVSAVDPGVVRTSLGSDQWIFRLVTKLPFVKRIEDGADVIVYAATAPDLERVSGKYFVGRKEAQSSAESNDPAVAKKLWEISEKMLG